MKSKKRDADHVAKFKREIEKELARRGVAFRWVNLDDDSVTVFVLDAAKKRSAMAGIRAVRRRLESRLKRQLPDA